MKIFFINNGMTHYYNLVLSKLNNVLGIELILIAPSQLTSNIGEGVHQTTEGVSFRVIKLVEKSRFGIYSSFRRLARILLREKPDIIIANESYLLTFLFNIPVILTMKWFGIKLIIKTIPFRMPKYDEVVNLLRKKPNNIRRLPEVMNNLFLKSGLIKLIRYLELQTRKLALNVPDAYVAYIDEAFDILGSYGIAKEKIFITRNSPDTDMLFDIKKSLLSAPSILPRNDHRLIHVGRLVEWKRVDLLMRAFARVKAQFKDAELVVIGTGPMEKTLKALSSDLGIKSDVKFLGGVYDPKLLGQYLMSSSIYVLAGMGGLSINDAMCFGLPVICSVCDGTEKMLVRDELNGKYFREGDEDDLVEKIRYLLNNPELRKKMGNKSIDIIRNEINIHTVLNGYSNALRYVYEK